MKTLVTILLSLVAFTAAKAQNTLIVDNNPNGIGQYTTLSAAISAATAGDIIMLIPSSTSYGDLTLTGSGKRLTIAGGGANGPTGRVSILGNVSLNGGSAANTNLDGFVIGGVQVNWIDVNFVDNIKLKAIKTTASITTPSALPYDLRIRSSKGAFVEFFYGGNAMFQADTNLQIYHAQFEERNTGFPAIVEIATTTNFVVSNSLLYCGDRRANNPILTVDNSSTGIFQNNTFYTEALTVSRPVNFGGAVVVVNNLFRNQNNYNAWPITNGQTYQNNLFTTPWGVTYFTYPAGLTIAGDGSKDANGNFFSTAGVFSGATIDEFGLANNSPAFDNGSGNDLDGTAADIGMTGGLDPMPSPRPSKAIGVSVVPSVTAISLSLPTAASGGQIILNATGKAKKN